MSSPIVKEKIVSRSWSNRRAMIRYLCPPATPARVGAEDLEFQRGWVQDLSVTGIGLLLARPLPTGQQVSIAIKTLKQEYQLTAQVMHSTEKNPGEWMIGLQFHDPLNLDDLEDLLS